MIGFRSRRRFVRGRCSSDFPVCLRFSLLVRLPFEIQFSDIAFLISLFVDLYPEQYAHMHLFHLIRLAFSGRLPGIVFVMPFADVMEQILRLYLACRVSVKYLILSIGADASILRFLHSFPHLSCLTFLTSSFAESSYFRLVLPGADCSACVRIQGEFSGFRSC